jgi:prophage regulatory protein
MAQAILRLPEVKARTGLSRSEIYRRESVGEFPRRVSLGARSVGWPATEVHDWIEARIRDSRKEAPR